MNTPAPTPAAQAADAKHRPTHKLPSFRIGFWKQMDLVRAYAALSENGTKPVHYTRVAEIVSVHEANVSSANPFFQSIGLILKASNGFLPSAALLEYNRAYSWDKDTAIVKLQPAILNTWFAQELTHRLQFRPLSEDAAILALAESCNAGPEAKPQLRVLLELCAATQIIDRANGQLTLLPVGVEEGKVAARQKRIEKEVEPEVDPKPEPVNVSSTITPSNDSQRDGAISLDIRMSVSMTEIQGWSPDRISAFFAGIAQVLAAKNQGG
jgi:hypothetical protein